MSFFNRLYKSEFKYIFPLVIISLIPRIGYFLFLLFSPQGLPQVYDMKWYLEHAYALLSDFRIDMDFNGIFYLAYYSFLALLLWIFRNEAGVVLFQLIVNALSVILVYKISIILFNRRTAILAGLIYAFTWQVIRWSMFIITDSFFITFLLLTVYLLLMYYNTHKTEYAYLFIVSSLYMIFLRPTGIITLTFIFGYIMINLNWKSFANTVKKTRLYLAGGGLIAAVVGVIFIINSGVLDPLFTSIRLNMEWLLRDSYIPGRIFDIETPYDYKYSAVINTDYFNSFIASFFANNYNHILVLYARRAISFFGVWIWKLGEVGFWVKLKYMLPFLSGIGVIAYALVEMARQGLLKRASVLLAVIMSIQFFCIIFFMDSAFRYRVPSLVFIAIITAYGFDRMLYIIEGIFSKSKGMV